MENFSPYRRSALFYYLATRLIEDLENEERSTREISRRSLLRHRINPIDISDIEFKNRYRLNKEAFAFLCRELRQRSNLTGSKRISLELKVLCALSFFATGSYQRVVGMAKYLGQTTVSKYIGEITDALITPNMINAFITFPTTRADRNEIRNKFYGKYGMPGVIGCIDGCHFHIFTPNTSIEHLYYCRKHFYSLNVQMTCDSECRITSINAKYGGATHDAFIWQNSALNSYMQQLHQNNEHVWLLGDSGYPQRPWIMTPIVNAVEGTADHKYNRVHSRTRVTIENTFGLLKNRWRCLCKDRTLHYSPSKCAKIIMACSVLHNITINFNLSNENNDEQNIDVGSSVWETYQENDSSDDLLRGRAMRSCLVHRINRLHTL